MPQVDYLPFATQGGSVNVDTQAGFAGSGYQLNGFSSGIAVSKQLNKVWRQASVVAAMIANFVSSVLGIDVLDDGNVNSLLFNFKQAVRNVSHGLVVVAFSATPTFDASQGNTFSITLTGNVTSSALINVSQGQEIVFLIKEDATGGRTFVAPVGVPIDAIDTTASKINQQAFTCDELGHMIVKTAMTVS